MSKKDNFVVGAVVETENYGVGEIVKVSQKETENGPVDVFAVKLENGDTRHFTQDELRLA